MKIESVWFRIDTNRNSGLGHVTRCVVLAHAFLDADKTVTLILNSFEKNLLPFIAGLDVRYIYENNLETYGQTHQIEDARRTLELIDTDAKETLVFVDHYELDEQWESLLKSQGFLVGAFDDDRSFKHSADILISDSSTPFDEKDIDVNVSPLILNGLPFSLISKEFFDQQREIKKSSRSVLVSYGGTDGSNQTAKAILALNHLLDNDLIEEKLNIDVIVGPNSYLSPEILRFEKRMNLVFHHSPKSLAPLMAKADVLMSSGGNTVLEAVASKCPCLVTITASNQMNTIRDLLDIGLIKLAGIDSEINAKDLAFSLFSMLEDIDELHHNLISSPIDVNGPQRIVDAVIRKAEDMTFCRKGGLIGS